MHSIVSKLMILSAGAMALVGAACSSAPNAPASTETTAKSSDALTYDDAVTRADEWVAVKLHYCQAPNGARDYDSACSTYCNRYSNPKWDPYRSDCSGLISWAWGLPAPGRVTGQFAPFQTDITHAIAGTDLRAGDAVNNSTHVMLFKSWVTHGSRAVFIEEPGCSSATPYAHEVTSDVSISGDSVHVSWNGETFTAIRYGALTAPPPPNTPPRGAMDKGACDALVGWAEDPDAPAAPLTVHLDFDAPAGTAGSGAITTTANVHRTDLCTSIGSCNHGFSVDVPLGLQDNKAHKVYAYGVDDSTSTVTTLLPGAPKTFTCAPPAVPFAPSAGVKRWVATQKVLAAWKIDPFLDVAREPKTIVDAYPKGPDFPVAPTAVVADDGSPEVWIVDGAVKRHVIDPASLTAWALTVAKWPAVKVKAIAQGADWPKVRFSFMADGAPEVYVLDSAPPSAAPDGGAPNGNGTGDTPSGLGAPGGPTADGAPATAESAGCALARGRTDGSSGAPLAILAGVAIALVFARRRRS